MINYPIKIKLNRLDKFNNKELICTNIEYLNEFNTFEVKFKNELGLVTIWSDLEDICFINKNDEKHFVIQSIIK
jgi:hypothetical protein